MSWPALRAVTRSELRGAWRNLVLIGLVAGIAGSAAVGALSVSRRTATAYDRLGALTSVDDVRGQANVDEVVKDIIGLPGVTDSWTGRMGIAQLEGTFIFLGIVAGPERSTTMLRPIVLEGRMPESATGDIVEVAVRDDFQREASVEVGTEVPATFLTRADYHRFDTGFEGGAPNGPTLTLRVVGVVRVAGGSSTMPPAFAAREALRDHPEAFEPSAVWFVRLSGGDQAVESFAADVDEVASAYRLPPEASEFRIADATATHTAAEGVDNTAELLGRALLVVAAGVALAGLVAVAQGLHRHHVARRDQTSVEAALGLTSGQRLLARLGATTIPAALATTLTATTAVWASRIEPLGAVRNYEPTPGAAPNLGLVLSGSAVAGALVLVITAATSTLAERSRVSRPTRPSWIVTWMSRLSRSTASVTGLRFAFEPGRGLRAVPVRSAIAGVAVGIAGAVAGLVFVSSLDRLTTSPERSGIPFDVTVSNVGEEDLRTLLANPAVASVVETLSAPVSVDSRTVPAYALTSHQGKLAIHLTEGRLPRTPDEVALGLRLQRDLGKGIGDTVTARDATGHTRPLAIVGAGVLPPFNGEQLGLNVILTPEALAEVGTSEAFTSAAVSARPGFDPADLASELSSNFEASPPPLPSEIDNLRQLGRLPTVAAAAVGLIALIALANAVTMLVRRRRGDLALLRTVGFTRAQTRSAVLVMAASIALVGVAIGVPIGLAVGGWAWQLTAQGAFVGTDSLTPSSLVAGLSVGAVAVAVVAAAVPALRAGRISPAQLLRAE